MNLKAILICDDIRIEEGGTLTIVGAYNDRLFAPPGEGPIVLPKLAFLAVVSGLKGIHRVGFRQRIKAVEDPDTTFATLEPQVHDAESAEHNFIFSQAPMMFPRPGAYEVVIDVDIGARTSTFRYRFTLERMKEIDG